MEPDYDKLLEEVDDAIGINDSRMLPVLKRHFEQFEKDILANVKSVTGLECGDCCSGLSNLGCTYCGCSISRFKKAGTWVHVDGDTDDY